MHWFLVQFERIVVWINKLRFFWWVFWTRNNQPKPLKRPEFFLMQLLQCSRYIIKTIPSVEEVVFRRLLPFYVAYLQAKTHSFLARFFGLFRLNSVKQHTSMCFTIMANVFGHQIDEQFDLKGWRVFRWSSWKIWVILIWFLLRFCGFFLNFFKINLKWKWTENQLKFQWISIKINFKI